MSPHESFLKYQSYVIIYLKKDIAESNLQLCSEDLVNIAEVEKQDRLLQEAFVCERPKTDNFKINANPLSTI